MKYEHGNTFFGSKTGHHMDYELELEDARGDAKRMAAAIAAGEKLRSVDLVALQHHVSGLNHARAAITRQQKVLRDQCYKEHGHFSYSKVPGYVEMDTKVEIIDAQLSKAAQRAGIVFWPALRIAGASIEALLVAQKVFKDICGPRNVGRHLEDQGITPNHGGWDSEGHWGDDGAGVLSIWRKCACTTGAKFKRLLHLAFRNAKRKMAPADTDWYARAGISFFHGSVERSRLATRWHLCARHFKKTAVALGKLSAFSRYAALYNAPEYPKIRELNWGAVRLMQRYVRGDKLTFAEFGEITRMLPKHVVCSLYLVEMCAPWFYPNAFVKKHTYDHDADKRATSVAGVALVEDAGWPAGISVQFGQIATEIHTYRGSNYWEYEPAYVVSFDPEQAAHPAIKRFLEVEGAYCYQPHMGRLAVPARGVTSQDDLLAQVNKMLAEHLLDYQRTKIQEAGDYQPAVLRLPEHMQLDVLKLFYAKYESEVLEVQELPDPLAMHCNRLTGQYHANLYAKVGQISAVDWDKAAEQWGAAILQAQECSPETFHQFF